MNEQVDGLLICRFPAFKPNSDVAIRWQVRDDVDSKATHIHMCHWSVAINSEFRRSCSEAIILVFNPLCPHLEDPKNGCAMNTSTHRKKNPVGLFMV